MKKQLFTPQQLFHLKRKTLEKRITNFYQETGNGDMAIKYLIALQVRDELGTEDFRWMLKDLARHVFLKTKATRTLRRYFNYFKDYFTAREWRKMVARLLSSKNWLAEKLAKLGTKITGMTAQIFNSAVQTPEGTVIGEQFFAGNQLLESPLNQIKAPTDPPKKRRWRLLERLGMVHSS